MTVRVAGLALSIIAGIAAAHAEHPNVVFILADDLGYGDVQALNAASRIPTPHLNRLAESGLTFRDAHTPSSVCTPTRYGLLTGRYCWRTRLKSGVLDGYGEPLIERTRETLGSFLRRAGYHTSIVGKWHLGLGFQPSNRPGAIDFSARVNDTPVTRGFDSSFIIPASLDFPPYVYIRDDRVTSPDVAGQAAQKFPAFLREGSRADDLVMEDCLDRLAEEATGIIARRAAERSPFFLYFPLTAPHKPVLPHARFRGATELGPYGDFVVQVDDTVGRVLDAIEEAGIAENTLVVFTSDNGSFMYRRDVSPDHVEDEKVQVYRAEHHRANGEWRGTKADIWEAGHRVPFFVRWPARIGAERSGTEVSGTICLTDVMATLAAIVGRPVPGSAEDSYSFLPLIEGRTDAHAREPVVHHSVNGMFAVRRGPWKLVMGNGSGGRERPRGEPFARPYQLFHLEEDPGETRDRVESDAAVTRELEAAFHARYPGFPSD